MDKRTKIYIAGHNGLLGSALLRNLKAAGYSNLVSKGRQALELTDKKVVFDFFSVERPDCVFLAAGITGGIQANKTYPADFFHVNIAIQDNVFEAVREFDVKHLVFYGSSCMYPKLSAQPMEEEYLLTGQVEETSEAYAMAKLAGVKACAAYNRQFKNGRFIALIPNSMYGPQDSFDPENSHVLSALIGKFHAAKKAGAPSLTLWGSGRPRREFIYVDDVAAASVFAVENAERLDGGCYNVGSGSDCSIEELAGQIAAVTGYSGQIIWDQTKPDGTPKKLLDSSRFLALGWQPRVSLAAGLKTTYEWFVNQENNAG